jgi:acyl-CoA thioester hydrolase
MLEDYPVVTDVVVRWGDMDNLGHVNHLLYLRYFEIARIEYLLRLGMEPPGPEWRESGVIIKSVSCRFKAAVTFPDTLSVGARITSLGDDTAIMEHVAVSQKLGEVAAIGDAVMVAYDYVALRRNVFSPEARTAVVALEGRELPCPAGRRTRENG